jgi:hypothetical protein
MHASEHPPLVVLSLSQQGIQAKSNDADITQRLRQLGFEPNGPHMLKDVATESELHAVVNQLIAMDAAFSAGHGWSPAEMLELLRDQGVFTGPYKMIAWRGPGDFETRLC